MTKTEIKSCAFSCGRAAYQGKRLCKSHLEHQRKKMAAYRLARKKEGLCSRCDNPARIMSNGSTSTLCERCRTIVRTLEQLESNKEGRLVRNIIKAKASGKTFKEIGARKGLTVEKIRRLLKTANT